MYTYVGKLKIQCASILIHSIANYIYVSTIVCIYYVPFYVREGAIYNYPFVFVIFITTFANFTLKYRDCMNECSVV